MHRGQRTAIITSRSIEFVGERRDDQQQVIAIGAPDRMLAPRGSLVLEPRFKDTSLTRTAVQPEARRQTRRKPPGDETQPVIGLRPYALRSGRHVICGPRPPADAQKSPSQQNR